MSAEFVERFKRFWAAPDPAALDELLHENARLVQPLMPAARSRAAYAEAMRRLLAVCPTCTAARTAGVRPKMAC
jgi:hypothetical protein